MLDRPTTATVSEPQYGVLLFSFELCRVKCAGYHVVEDLEEACYFLLNYAYNFHWDGSGPYEFNLLFSFELCSPRAWVFRVLTGHVRGINSLLFSFELCVIGNPGARSILARSPDLLFSFELCGEGNLSRL